MYIFWIVIDIVRFLFINLFFKLVGKILKLRVLYFSNLLVIKFLKFIGVLFENFCFDILMFYWSVLREYFYFKRVILILLYFFLGFYFLLFYGGFKF